MGKTRDGWEAGSDKEKNAGTDVRRFGPRWAYMAQVHFTLAFRWTIDVPGEWVPHRGLIVPHGTGSRDVAGKTVPSWNLVC